MLVDEVIKRKQAEKDAPEKINHRKKLLVIKTEYELHSIQKEVMKRKERFLVIVFGRQSGKTFLAINMVIKYAQKPNSVIWWVSPTSNQSAKVFDEMKNILKDLVLRGKDKRVAKGIKLKDKKLQLINGTIIEFKGSDKPDNLRGETLDFVVLDECGVMKPNVFSAIIRPMLAAKESPALLIGTPKGKNWFYDDYIKGQKGSPTYNSEYFSLRMPSWSSPTISDKEIESQKKSMPELVFRQEYGAEFLDEVITLFSGLDKVYVPFEKIMSDDLMLSNMKSVTDMKYKEQINVLENIVKPLKNYICYIDETGIGKPFVELATQEGIRNEGFLFTESSKEELMNTLITGVDGEAFKIPNDGGVNTEFGKLIEEMKNMTFEYTDNGRMKFLYKPTVRVDNSNGDRVWALALAYWGYFNNAGYKYYIGVDVGTKINFTSIAVLRVGRRKNNFKRFFTKGLKNIAKIVKEM